MKVRWNILMRLYFPEIDERNVKSDSSKFKPIPNIEESHLKANIRALSFEQRVVFDRFVEVCKKKLMQNSRYASVVPPTKMIAHGKMMNVYCNISIINNSIAFRWGWSWKKLPY